MIENDRVIPELQSRLNASITGSLKYGTWQIRAERLYAYSPALPLRFVIDDAPISTSFRYDKVMTQCTMFINYYTMRNDFEQVVIEIDNNLREQYEDWLHKYHPEALPKKPSGLYEDMLRDMSPSEHRRLMFNDFVINPADRPALDKFIPPADRPSIGQYQGSRIYSSEFVPRGKAIAILRETEQELSRQLSDLSQEMMFKADEQFLWGRGRLRYGNQNIPALYAMGDHTTGWESYSVHSKEKVDLPDGFLEKQHRQVNPNWSQEWDEWRYSGKYMWKWMNRLGDWLNKQLKR